MLSSVPLTNNAGTGVVTGLWNAGGEAVPHVGFGIGQGVGFKSVRSKSTAVDLGGLDGRGTRTFAVS